MTISGIHLLKQAFINKSTKFYTSYFNFYVWLFLEHLKYCFNLNYFKWLLFSGMCRHNEHSDCIIKIFIFMSRILKLFYVYFKLLKYFFNLLIFNSVSISVLNSFNVLNVHNNLTCIFNIQIIQQLLEILPLSMQ